MTTASAAAQSTAAVQPAVEWEKALGDRWYDEGDSVVQAADGGFAIAGVATDLNRSGLGVFKADSHGSLQWEKMLNASGYQIIGTADGGYIIVGDLADGGQGKEACLVKVAANGSLEWQRVYSYGYSDSGMGVIQAGDGGYLVAGMDLPMNDVGRAFLMKVGTDGTEEWTRTYESQGIYSAMEIRSAGEGAYYIAGPADIGGKSGISILRVDSGGNVLWQGNFSGILANTNHALWDRFSCLPAQDGGFIVAGSSTDDQGVVNPCLARIDANGNVRWCRTIPDPLGGCFRAVVEDYDGGFIVAGFTNISYHKVLGFYDDMPRVYCVKFDGNGKLLWEKKLVYGYGVAMSPTADGGYVLTGQTWSKANGTQALLIKMSGPPAVSSAPAVYSPTISILDGPMSGMSLVFENNVLIRIIGGNMSAAPVEPGDMLDDTTPPRYTDGSQHKTPPLPPQVPTIKPSSGAINGHQ